MVKVGETESQSVVTNTTNSTANLEENMNYLEAVAYIVVFLTSVIGNTIVVIVVKRNFGGKFRSVSYYFILSLVLADLAMTIGNVPERITRAFTADKWILEGVLGIAVCKIVNFIEKCTILVSISSLAAIAIDRFLNVFLPHQIIITKKRSYIIISLIWILSTVYCIPILVYGNLLIKDDKTYCKTRLFFPKWALWFLPFLFLLLASLFIVFILYFFLCIKLWCKNSPGLQRYDSNVQATARGTVNRKVLKMVSAIVIAFYICFLPYLLGWIFCSYHFTTLICNKTYTSVSIFLSYVNIAINPIIYVYFSENFREAFNALFRNSCLKIRNRSRVNPRRPHVNELLAGISLKSTTFFRPTIPS